MTNTVFNRESVLTAGMLAVQERGWYYRGGDELFNPSTNESCLVGSIAIKQGVEIGRLMRENSLDNVMRAIGERATVGPEVRGLLTRIMALDDQGLCWGRVMEEVM